MKVPFGKRARRPTKPGTVVQHWDSARPALLDTQGLAWSAPKQLQALLPNCNHTALIAPSASLGGWLTTAYKGFGITCLSRGTLGLPMRGSTYGSVLGAPSTRKVENDARTSAGIRHESWEILAHEQSIYTFSIALPYAIQHTSCGAHIAS